MNESRERITAFLGARIPGITLTPDEDIFARGYVTSLFVMELVLFVENEFAITIESEDLDFDNFRTVEALARLVERKPAANDPDGSAGRAAHSSID